MYKNKKTLSLSYQGERVFQVDRYTSVVFLGKGYKKKI